MSDIGVVGATLAACGLLAASAAWDLRQRRIPNAIPLLLLLLFALRVWADATPGRVVPWANLAIGGVLLAAGFVLYLTGRFGAGDGKLLAVSGLWVGPADLSLFLFGVGGCTLALCAFASLPLETARRVRPELPLALAIAPPAVVVLALRVPA